MHIPFDPAICFLDFKAIIPPMHKDTHMKMFFVMLVKRVRISKDFFFFNEKEWEVTFSFRY